MPAYNFKAEFVAAVKNGSKLSTIRQIRKKRPTRLGDRLFLFTRMRQTHCTLIRDTECVRLTSIKIDSGPFPSVNLGGNWKLTQQDVKNLACRDGFRDSVEFYAFFAKTYGPNFEGELIEWAP